MKTNQNKLFSKISFLAGKKTIPINTSIADPTTNIFYPTSNFSSNERIYVQIL